MQNLYGHETATDNIVPTSIFYGFRIQRTWNNTTRRTTSTFEGRVVGYEGDYKAGGFYKILEVRKNLTAIYPPNTNWESVASSLAEDIKNNLPTFLMPTYTAGFKPSNIRALASEI